MVGFDFIIITVIILFWFVSSAGRNLYRILFWAQLLYSFQRKTERETQSVLGTMKWTSAFSIFWYLSKQEANSGTLHLNASEYTVISLATEIERTKFFSLLLLLLLMPLKFILSFFWGIFWNSTLTFLLHHSLLFSQYTKIYIVPSRERDECLKIELWYVCLYACVPASHIVPAEKILAWIKYSSSINWGGCAEIVVNFYPNFRLTSSFIHSKLCVAVQRINIKTVEIENCWDGWMGRWKRNKSNLEAKKQHTQCEIKTPFNWRYCNKGLLRPLDRNSRSLS